MQARIAMYVQHSFATPLHPSPLQLWHSPAVSESSRDLLMSIEGDGTSEFPLIAPSNSTQAEPYAEYRRSIRRLLQGTPDRTKLSLASQGSNSLPDTIV